MNKKIIPMMLLWVIIVLITSCQSKENIETSITNSDIQIEEKTTMWDINKPQKEVTTLDISFTDPAWDWKKVPEWQQCKMYEWNGSSPELIIKNIPEWTKSIRISYNDRTYQANDNGGHGIVGILVDTNNDSIVVPSFEGESFELPENMFVIEKFRSNRWKDGAYLPPCSGWIGNEYYISFQALDNELVDSDSSTVLAKGEIEMWKY